MDVKRMHLEGRGLKRNSISFWIIGCHRERQADTKKPGEALLFFEETLWFFYMPSV